MLLSAYMERGLEEQEDILNQKQNLDLEKERQRMFCFEVVEVGGPDGGTAGQS